MQATTAPATELLQNAVLAQFERVGKVRGLFAIAPATYHKFVALATKAGIIKLDYAGRVCEQAAHWVFNGREYSFGIVSKGYNFKGCIRFSHQCYLSSQPTI